jgi:(1->4)-alpha-D-glucan 1-alpha-D-glucosylmutase
MTTVARRQLGSTYRLQLNGLGFAGATDLVPFLHRLGIETCYVSPVTQARLGSTHGYDVIDPTRLDPELGTPAELEQLLAALEKRQMGLLIDIVPNHLAASPQSPFFSDVLRQGLASEYAPWFDIAWDEQDGRILLPVLGESLAAVLNRGELQVRPAGPDGAAALTYFDERFPLSPESVGSAAKISVEELLKLQHYRLADWRLANQLVNYRRFFDINELIGVRQEDPAVFAATHSLILDLLEDPRVRGVRVDHIDGLRDPEGYLAMLRAATQEPAPAPVLIVEKILAADERLPAWPVEGTTGYEIGTAIVGLLIDPVGAADLTAASAVATGDSRSFGDRAHAAKRDVLAKLFPGQLERVVTLLAGEIPAAAGVDRTDLAAALVELIEQLGVYRTYRRADLAPTADDIEHLGGAATEARDMLSGHQRSALDLLMAVLLGPVPAGSSSWEAVASWQQLSGPATAKGVEDTAMYDSGTPLAVVDVGSDPDQPSLDVERFHAMMTRRAGDHPLALTSTSTHDSKRSHDVRCRLAVLSEIAARWTATVRELDVALGVTDRAFAPDAADRDYLYQTLVGVWPVDHAPDAEFVAQVQGCLLKSAREAKRRSTWADPDHEYEGAYQDLARRATTGRAGELLRFVVADIECAAATNALASVLLKATVPGVPDTYQGDDDWFFALVDPDNRRRLDRGHHEKLLEVTTEQAIERWRDGQVKALVLGRALQARRDHAEVFASGSYEALEVTGAGAGHLIAFARRGTHGISVTVVPRLVQNLAAPGSFALGEQAWADTRVVQPTSGSVAFVEAITGREAVARNGSWSIAELFAELPVALLEGWER